MAMLLFSSAVMDQEAETEDPIQKEKSKAKNRQLENVFVICFLLFDDGSVFPEGKPLRRCRCRFVRNIPLNI